MANLAHPSRRIFFVTATTYERRPIFQISRVAELFIETLLHYRTHGHYKLHAFLVMPDHVHLLLTPHSIDLDRAISLIQSGFARRLASKHTLWEPGFTAHPVNNQRDLDTLRTYIHQTPVRANLTTTPELYPYSSAYRQEQKLDQKIPASAATPTTSLSKTAS
jgi:putative transposase